MTNLIILNILGMVVLIDLWLIFTKRPTISQAYQRLYPTFFDLALMVIIVVILCMVSLDTRLKVSLAVITGHVFWPNEEKYRK